MLVISFYDEIEATVLSYLYYKLLQLFMFYSKSHKGGLLDLDFINILQATN